MVLMCVMGECRVGECVVDVGALSVCVLISSFVSVCVVLVSMCGVVSCEESVRVVVLFAVCAICVC